MNADAPTVARSAPTGGDEIITPRATRSRRSVVRPAEHPATRAKGAVRRSGAIKDSTDTDTRDRVIEAAIKTIHEMGFYRASSNAIAERAGLSWGVIQYYFGTREALMLAVLDEGTRRLARVLREAEIGADTLLGRIEEYFEVLARYYAAPDYLVFTQVLIDLSHDPGTSEQTRQTMADMEKIADPEFRRLTRQVFAGTGVRRTVIRNLVFHSLRGMALSYAMLGTLPPGAHHVSEQQFPAQRKLMARALALLIEEECAKRK